MRRPDAAPIDLDRVGRRPPVAAPVDGLLVLPTKDALMTLRQAIADWQTLTALTMGRKAARGSRDVVGQLARGGSFGKP